MSSDSSDSLYIKHSCSDVDFISGRGDKFERLSSELYGSMTGMICSLDVGGVSGRDSSSESWTW